VTQRKYTDLRQRS